MNKLQLLIICLTFSLSFANDCQIRYDFDQSIDSSEWHTCNWLNSFTSTNFDLIYECNGLPQFGGFDQFGKGAWAQTAIVAIPSHTAVNIKLTLLAIDSWDSEYFYVYADGAKVYEEQFNWDVGTDDCGNGWLERTSEISITVDHSASSLEVYLTSNLDEDAANESWGISNFIVEYVTDDECAVYEDLDDCNESRLEDQNLCPLFNDLDQLTQTFPGLQTADAWTLDATYDDPFTLCDQYHMLGGYGVFGSGAFAETRIENIPAHEYLHLKLTFYSIDSWDTETYTIYLDDELLIQKAQVYNEGTDLCGNGGSWMERINYHDIIVPHTDDLAIFTIQTTLDQSSTDESWGISDFVVEYYTTDDCYWGYDDVPTVETLFGKNECLVKCELGQSQVEDYTTQDISGWVFDGADTTDVFNTCGDDYSMVGGYGVFGSGASASTTVDNLPEHKFVAITFTAFIGDSWDNEYFEVYVDDEQVKHENFYYADGPSNNCGGGWNEQYASIELYISHTADTLNIKLTSTLDQGSTDENWGFSDFKLTYFTDDDCGEYASGDTCWFNVLDCDVVTVYEFCDYTGRRVEVDDKVDCIDWDPQAICIPAGESATIYDLCWYDGGDVTITESSACLSTGSIGTGLLSKNEDAKKNKKVKQHGLNSVVEVHH